MKKSLTFFLLMCLFATFLSAQTSFYASDINVSGGDAPIVRSWDNGNAAITYYEVGLNRYIQYVDYGSGNSYRVKAPYHMKIFDMYIYDDYVYYCGYSVLDTGGTGVIGYFNPSDFYTSTQVKFHTLLVRPLSYVNKLVAQQSPSGTGVEIIAIGEHQWNDTIHEGSNIINIPHLIRHFVMCHDIMQTVVVYDTMVVPSEEHYFNVLLTNNFVVFVGIGDYLSQKLICLRKRDRTITTPPNWLLNYVYAFPTGIDEVYSALHSTAMTEDEIATAYMHIDPVTKNVSNRVRIIETAQMLSINSQEYLVPDKSEVRDIVFFMHDNSLVCMQDFNTPLNNYNTNFVSLDPYAYNNYTVLIEYLKGVFFKSMTTKGHNYLASHGQTWFLKDKLILPPYPNDDCPKTEKIDCDIIESPPEIHAGPAIIPYTTQDTIFINNQSVEPMDVSVTCDNP